MGSYAKLYADKQVAEQRLAELKQAAVEAAQSDDRWYTNGGQQKNMSLQMDERRKIAELDHLMKMEKKLYGEELITLLRHCHSFIMMAQENYEEGGYSHKRATELLAELGKYVE